MTHEVGKHAGNILMLLSGKGNLSIREIGEQTQCKDKLIYLALGWLLRENKIECFEKDGSICVKFNSNTLTEIYY